MLSEILLVWLTATGSEFCGLHSELPLRPGPVLVGVLEIHKVLPVAFRKEKCNRWRLLNLQKVEIFLNYFYQFKITYEYMVPMLTMLP